MVCRSECICKCALTVRVLAGAEQECGKGVRVRLLAGVLAGRVAVR